ncbi:MAG: segregation/condensation protein A [Defluviitaleaceae bacterium]|nr:segregation/condensation protein A [Defluviitaleaceae bacterium]
MEVKLAAYEGPLDLLLSLIRRNEIDIYDIPIAELTTQYMEAIAEIKEDPGLLGSTTLGQEANGAFASEHMDKMSEFVLMAATLLEIKSRMLLPKAKPENDAADEEDPREALVQKLLAYQEAQALAAELTRISPPGLRITGSGDPELLETISTNIDNQTPIMEGVELSRLWDIFADIMNRRAARRDLIRAGFGEMPRERFTVPEKIAYIRACISEVGHVRLFSLFEYCRSRTEIVVTFLALLEMVRRGMVKTRQSAAFDDVYCESA